MKKVILLNIWFFMESYKYQNPRGFKQHVKYICYYPNAHRIFMDCCKEDERHNFRDD